MNFVSMEPLLPAQNGPLRDLALELGQKSARLEGGLAPETKAALAALLRTINSYYSNLIEGHRTHLRLIEAAVQGIIGEAPGATRDLQLLHQAHVAVQGIVERQVSQGAGVTSPEFLCGIHRELYSRLPLSMRVQATAKGTRQVAFAPGELRNDDVEVGRHVPPPHAAIPVLLERFAQAYAPEKHQGDQKLIAAAASHHRLTWVHPFFDGNGRVARLFTHAYFMRIGLAGFGLWTASRGLARSVEAYKQHLAGADSPRRGDFDGRGPLSEAGLPGCCRYFLKTCVDQADFMGQMLDLAHLRRRVLDYAERRSKRLLPGLKPLHPGAGRLLVEIYQAGRLGKSEVPALLGLSERTAREIVKTLLEEGLVEAANQKAPLTIGFPSHVLDEYFPALCYKADTVSVP
ncbi:MAG: Fic family protein [Humidesulfovibrio sp.]|nr:Fic family protein [Humidesulfovibrio sp.]